MSRVGGVPPETGPEGTDQGYQRVLNGSSSTTNGSVSGTFSGTILTDEVRAGISPQSVDAGNTFTVTVTLDLPGGGTDSYEISIPTDTDDTVVYWNSVLLDNAVHYAENVEYSWTGGYADEQAVELHSVGLPHHTHPMQS